MNTKFSYLYRDAGNYKFFKDVVLDGVLSLDQLNPSLWESEYFIPSEVGLPDLQPEPLTVDDHIWHEIDAIEYTDDEPTTDISATSLVERFKISKKNSWNQIKVYKRKGML